MPGECIQRILETLCSGLMTEAQERKRIYEKTGGDEFKFSLLQEREIGLVTVFAYYLRQNGVFTRQDWYFYSNPNENIDMKRPDLTIWLPESKRLLYLELKQVGRTYPYNGLRGDMKKLDRVSKTNEKNKLSGLIGVQFAESAGPLERLGKELEELRKVYPDYRLHGPRLLQLADMDGHPTHAAIGILFRDESNTPPSLVD